MTRGGIGAASLSRGLASIGLAILVGFSAAAAAHDGQHAKAALARDGGAPLTEVDLPDVELIDRHGRPTNFRADVIGERIVVINFIYTSCSTVCPVSTAIFGQVQQRLGARLGEEVVLVSLSVDPVTDRPPRLSAYARRHNAGPGWIWLTGNKLSVDKLLEGLGAYTPNYRDHPAMVLVGDARTGRWTRFFGFPSPDQIMSKVDGLLAARAQTQKLSATAPQR